MTKDYGTHDNINFSTEGPRFGSSFDNMNRVPGMSLSKPNLEIDKEVKALVITDIDAN